MKKERIFIVEDEGIVAADLQSILQGLQYEVVGTASSGEEAVEKVEKLTPDLVLMDIRLKGEMDGIDAAEQITARMNIPVTFLTAYADNRTLERAKTTMPYGYILKPFEEKDLRTAVELALYKHQMESMMSTIEGWHATALQSMAEAVIATDPQGNITFMNEAAESLSGWKLTEAYGKKAEEFFSLSLLKTGSTQSFHSLQPVSLSTKKGGKIKVQYSLSPIKNEEGRATGTIIVLRNASL